MNKENLFAVVDDAIGYKEGPNNWNKFAQDLDTTDTYNGIKQNQAWCDIFVDWCFQKAFGHALGQSMLYQPPYSYGAGCAESAQYYRAKGAFHQTPEPGDQVFFYVSGGINHTGIVREVHGGTIVTVEGNSSDSVRRLTYKLPNSIIAGYGRPNWSLLEGNNLPVEENPKQPTAVKQRVIKTLKLGDKNNYVKGMQALLTAHGFQLGIWGCDGDFGQSTLKALKEFQTKVGIESDGICGAETWNALTSEEK